MASIAAGGDPRQHMVGRGDGRVERGARGLRPAGPAPSSLRAMRRSPALRWPRPEGKARQAPGIAPLRLRLARRT